MKLPLVFSLVFVCVHLSVPAVAAPAAKQDALWYQSILKGRAALSQNNYTQGQTHFVAALKDLEKIVSTKGSTVSSMTSPQRLALGTLYVELADSFRLESIEHGLNRIEAIRLDTSKDKAGLNPLDFQRQISDLEQRSKDLDAQKIAMDAKDKERAHRDIELQRRILAVYKVLLGPNKSVTRLCKQNFDEDLDRYNHAIGVVPKDVLAKEEAKRRLESKWHDADWKATQASSDRDYVKAANFHREAITEAERLGPKSVRLPESLSNLAGVERMHLNKLQDAELHYKQALAHYERILGRNDTKVWETLLNLTAVYMDTGQKSEKEIIEKRMAEMEK